MTIAAEAREFVRRLRNATQDIARSD